MSPWKSLPGMLWVIAAFLSGKLLLFIGYPELGWQFLTPELWVRWDSGHYFAIAQHGYEAFPCWTRFPEYAANHNALCGNCGWMPGFPALIWLLQQTGLSAAAAAQVIVQAAFLLFLSFLWNKVFRGLGLNGTLLLFLSACWPGAVYFQAAFPIALFALVMVMCLYYLKEEQWPQAMLCAAGASMVYSTGFLLGVSIIPYIVFRYRADVQKMLRSLLVPISSFAGFSLVLGIQWMQTGIIGAFFQTQSKYGHGMNSPLKMLGLIIQRAINAPQFEVRFSDWVTLLLTAGLLILLLWYFLRGRDFALKLLLLGYVGCFWFVPLSMSPHLAFYRQAAALAPLALFLTALPRKALFSLLICALIINPVFARLFLLDLLP